MYPSYLGGKIVRIDCNLNKYLEQFYPSYLGGRVLGRRAGALLASVDPHGALLLLALLLRVPPAPGVQVFSGTVFSYRVFLCSVHCTVFSCTVFSCTVVSCTVFSCTVLSCIVFSCTVFCCTVFNVQLYSNQLYGVQVYSVVRLYSAVKVYYTGLPKSTMQMCVCIV